MKITYELTQREKDFLEALRDKPHPKFGFWGAREDDKFREEWKEEIDIFNDNELFESVDRGPYSYWQRILNERGMALYEFLT